MRSRTQRVVQGETLACIAFLAAQLEGRGSKLLAKMERPKPAAEGAAKKRGAKKAPGGPAKDKGGRAAPAAQRVTRQRGVAKEEEQPGKAEGDVQRPATKRGAKAVEPQAPPAKKTRASVKLSENGKDATVGESGNAKTPKSPTKPQEPTGKKKTRASDKLAVNGKEPVEPQAPPAKKTRASVKLSENGKDAAVGGSINAKAPQSPTKPAANKGGKRKAEPAPAVKVTRSRAK